MIMPFCCICIICWCCCNSRWFWAICAAVGPTFIIWPIPWGFMSMACPICCAAVIIPGGGLACVMRGFGTTCGREIGVACAMFGVAEGILGVPAGWLCWLPRADMLGAMGTPIGWFWTTDGGLAGLAAACPMFEFECCMATPAIPIGEDAVCGVFCRTIGDET